MYDAIAAIAVRQVGLVTREDLSGLGLDDFAIGRRTASGFLEQVHPGVYRIAGHPATLEQRLMAALLASQGRSAVAFEAAAMLYDIDRIRTDKPHILIVHAQVAKLEGVVVHRTRLLAPGDIVKKGPLRVTSPYRTIIDLAAVLPVDRLEDALDDAIRRNLVSVKSLQKHLEIRGRRGVRGIGRLAALLEARVGKPKKASSLQNKFRRGLERAGLPAPVEEFNVFDSSGRWVARVDFAYPDKQVYLEVDGSHHETRKQKQLDLARQNRLAGAGWTPLRYDNDAIRARTYVAEIGTILRSG